MRPRAPVSFLVLGLLCACEGAIGANFERGPKTVDPVSEPSPTLPSSPNLPQEAGTREPMPEAGTPPDPPVRVACGDTNGLDPKAPWPMAGYCPTRAGASPAPALKMPRIAWRYAFEDRAPAMRTQPSVAADGTVYVIASSIPSTKVVYKLLGIKDRIETVRVELPEGPLASGPPGTPVLARDGSVYVAGNGWLMRLNPDGSEVWKVSLGASAPGSPLILGDGTIVTPASDGVRGIHPTDGSTAWTYQGAGFYGSVAMTTTGLLVCAQSPAPGAFQGQVHMFDDRGMPRWNVKLGLPAYQSPATDAFGRTFVGSGNQFFMLTPSGTPSFITSVSGNSLSESMALTALMLPSVHWVAGHFDPISVDPESGSATSRSAIEGVTSGFVGTADGSMVVAIRQVRNDRVEGLSSDGTTRWSVPIENASDTPNTPALGAKGEVYVTVDNVLYAISDP